MVGKKIRKARRAARFRQSEISGIIGVPASNISNWENDRRKVPLAHVALLSKLLRLPREDIRPDIYTSPS